MDFQTSVKTCLTQKYASFQGRASRPEYWWFILVYVVGAILVALTGVGFLYVLYLLAMLVPVTAAGWRRLQDTGRPGWYILIPVGISVLSMILAPTMPHDAGFDGEMGMGMGMGGMAADAPGMGRLALGAILGVIQLVLLVLYIWWLTRPSQPETNEYGPPPAS